jgi:hypothetical protein
MKIPEPIIDPDTIITESSNPSERLKSDKVFQIKTFGN